MRQPKYPAGGDEERVRRVLAHYQNLVAAVRERSCAVMCRPRTRFTSEFVGIQTIQVA